MSWTSMGVMMVCTGAAWLAFMLGYLAGRRERLTFWP